MTWKIAQAKQSLSRVIRAAADEPQVIFNRNRPVAAVLSGEAFEDFEAWRQEKARQRPLPELFAELRALCMEEDYTLPVVDRRDRANPFADDLEPA